MSNYYYKIEGSEYVLYNDENVILRSDYGVALVYTYNEEISVLHKHGMKKHAQKWYNNAVNKYKNSGFEKEASELIMVFGRFPVDEVNKCINNSGYTKKFHEKIMNNEMPCDETVHPDIDEFL